MRKIFNCVLAAILISGATVLTAWTNDDNATVVTESSITQGQSRVGYSAWNTQVSYTHCDPLPKTGKPELVSGTWEMNDGILQLKAYEQAPLAICNYVIPSDHYTIRCTARKDSGPEGFIIVFNYVDAQHYCWLNFGCEGNTQHAIEQTNGECRKRLVTRPGSVKTGKWYDVRLTAAGSRLKVWLDDSLMFDEKLNISVKREQSQTDLSFAECEKFQPQVNTK